MQDNKLLNELVNFINTFIHDFNIIRTDLDKVSSIEELSEYKKRILYLSNVYSKMAYGMDILNVVKNDNIILYNNKIMKLCSNSICIPNIKSEFTPIIINPTNNDSHSILVDTIPDYSNINILKVKNDIELPNTNIYYIEENAEYGIKINNNLITGNIMNIVSKANQTNINPCKVINCTNVNCKYYHKYKLNKNFNHSKYYEYNTLDYKFRNLLFESKSKLHTELHKLTKDYKDYRKHKLMHEILLFQIISNVC
jgi:hypothetical protein